MLYYIYIYIYIHMICRAGRSRLGVDPLCRCCTSPSPVIRWGRMESNCGGGFQLELLIRSNIINLLGDLNSCVYYDFVHFKFRLKSLLNSAEPAPLNLLIQLTLIAIFWIYIYIYGTIQSAATYSS